MNSYQFDYAAGRPQMYDLASRKRKAVRIIKTLSDYYGNQKKFKKLDVLDIGSSTGIIDSVLVKYFRKLIGCDIDKEAVEFAKRNFKSKNLHFKVEDAMKLIFNDNSFDVVICTQVYEHVPNSQQLFFEIYRVLKKGGACYFAALNRLWPWEPHYDLPFLSWLPKSIANFYVKITNRGKKYYETPKTYWKLKKLAQNFKVVDYTEKILKRPKKFGYSQIPIPVSSLSALLKYFTPTFFWVLVKE